MSPDELPRLQQQARVLAWGHRHANSAMVWGFAPVVLCAFLTGVAVKLDNPHLITAFCVGLLSMVPGHWHDRRAAAGLAWMAGRRDELPADYPEETP